MVIPHLSTQQREAARAAAQARRARAELKTQGKLGHLPLGDALDKAAADDTLPRVKVVDLLRCLPRVGEARSAAIMERLDIAANRRIRGLGRHQVGRLRTMLT